jgi:hypothetical protein
MAWCSVKVQEHYKYLNTLSLQLIEAISVFIYVHKYVIFGLQALNRETSWEAVIITVSLDKVNKNINVCVVSREFCSFSTVSVYDFLPQVLEGGN